jgi:hypothetical protein
MVTNQSYLSLDIIAPLILKAGLNYELITVIQKVHKILL